MHFSCCSKDQKTFLNLTASPNPSTSPRSYSVISGIVSNTRHRRARWRQICRWWWLTVHCVAHRHKCIHDARSLGGASLLATYCRMGSFTSQFCYQQVTFNLVTTFVYIAEWRGLKHDSNFANSCWRTSFSMGLTFLLQTVWTETYFMRSIQPPCSGQNKVWIQATALEFSCPRMVKSKHSFTRSRRQTAVKSIRTTSSMTMWPRNSFSCRWSYPKADADSSLHLMRREVSVVQLTVISQEVWFFRFWKH